LRNTKSLIAWLIVLALTGLLAACGSSSSSEPAAATPTGPAAQGIAVDPYISGAIFQEVSANGTLLQRQSTASDAAGHFSFPQPLTPGSIVELKVSAKGMHNGVPYPGMIRRLVDDSVPATWVVSPLTTLTASGLSEQQVLDFFAGAGLLDLTASDLTADPMASIDLGGAVSAGTRLAPLQAAMAANAFMQAVNDYEMTTADLNDASRVAVFDDMVTAATQFLSVATFNDLANDPAVITGGAPLSADDLIRTAAHLCQMVSDQVRLNPSMPMATEIDNLLASAPTYARQYHEARTGMPGAGNGGGNTLPGQTLYDSHCASCHKLGSIDTTGVAPDLNNNGSLIAAKLQSDHNGIALSAAETAALGTWVDSNSTVVTPAPDPVPTPTPDPTTPPDGAALYAMECAGCHGNLASTNKPGRTAAQTQAAITANLGGMGGISLTAAELQAIADALATVTPPTTPGPDYSDCTTCHSQPPNGTAFPNGAGAHAVHNSLPGVGTTCAVCHTGAAHNGWIDLGFQAVYNAKSGAATENPDGSATCSNISCHGGQTTPDWATGAINVNTQCTSCHDSGSGQYNSYASGQHGRSNHARQACTVCHNTTSLASTHFSRLNTPALEGPASATVGGGSTRVSNYNASTKTCTTSCHGSEGW
jgi:predicted CxxxxCH...CXXCH cytochrome family protein